MAFLLGSCTIATGPSSPEEAFATARLTQPADAQDVRFAGDHGIDSIVLIQLVLPSPAAAETFTQSFGCALAPVVKRRDNPFIRVDKGDPDWWVHAAPEGARFCSTEPVKGQPVFRHVRVDPLPDGKVRVQLSATTA